jgi:hypothetical protein
VLIDRTHRRWIWATLLLTLVAAGAYVPYHLNGPLTGPRGGTWQGLTYGGIAAALMLWVGAIGLRRRVRARNLGRAETWLRGHIWLGLLAYVLVFFHAGFRVGGALSGLLLALFTVVVVTGIYGLVVQHVVPRLMTAQLPHESLHDQTPLYTQRLREEATRAVLEVCGYGPVEPGAAEKEALAGGRTAPRRGGKEIQPIEGSAPVQEFFKQEVEPFLATGAGRLGGLGNRRALFAHVRTLSGPGVHATLDTLEALCEERRRVDAQLRLHGWLHGWLLIHLPLAYALIALTVVHAVASVYY